ncbi:mechanosensitive ion channel family protein [Alteromonas sp. 009811495]|uniref:mechanosensitive ion channel family protein n=2 Tax=Alteromonas sp. 009811495 TaxID=3002962 RepID=UPI00237E8F70|nr:mechanosensitive ion channel family protein [Alteromonas sp. 009811495]WDT86975.1 mechanosensitive ion channel family protein [Alteromonas sp. 009811495]
MEISSFLQNKQAMAIVSLVAVVVLLFVIKRLILVRLKEKARSETSSMSNIYRVLVLSLNAPLNLLILVIFLSLVKSVVAVFQVEDKAVVQALSISIEAGLIITLFLLLERFVTYSLRRYRDQSTLVKNTSAIASGAVRAVFAIMAVLIILSTMGISITPVVASLGITSLAVALALQPTLENFFSGIQLVMDKPIRIGDFIELDSGEQGFVEKIGWRSTWVRMLPNNIVIMPNSKLSNSKLINYYYPERELSVPVEVGVHYSSDLEQVEKVCLAVAEDILAKHEYGVKTFQPFVLFHTFDNSSINLTVMLRTREYFNRFFIKSAFIKALKKRFDEEGIVIPFPITALNIDQERTDAIISQSIKKHS